MYRAYYEEGITMKELIIDTTAIELPAREVTAETTTKYAKMNKLAEATSIIERNKSETPKNWLKNNMFSISMLVLWSITFGTALHGLTGVALGLCFGMILIQAKDQKDEK